MALRLIGAGLPRTGTSSLREALQLLLSAPVYHMSEAFAHPAHAPTWVSAIDGDAPDWDRFLAGYAAGVDAPFSNCWRALSDAYPETPVLLSRRAGPEVWLRSMEATVLPRAREMLAKDDGDPLVPLFRVAFRDLLADLDDRDEALVGYRRRLDEVRAEIAPHRLVEWEPGDGWRPRCRAPAATSSGWGREPRGRHAHARVGDALGTARPTGRAGGEVRFHDAPSAGRWVAAAVRGHWSIRVDACERIVISGR